MLTDWQITPFVEICYMYAKLDTYRLGLSVSVLG